MRSERLSIGVQGLDQVLLGGLNPNRIYLLEGDPGTGKTTLALQFMLEGARAGEKCLYITLSETAEELRAVAHSHGWSLDPITIFELTPPEANFSADQYYTLLHPSEVELSETIKLILDRIEALQPDRVAFDSLAEIRLLAQDPLRYRRQVLALKQFFAGRRSTALLLDDLTSRSHELQVHSITHGVIVLERLVREYGAERRRIQVTKMRGASFRGGYHDVVIATGGSRFSLASRSPMIPEFWAADKSRAGCRHSMPCWAMELIAAPACSWWGRRVRANPRSPRNMHWRRSIAENLRLSTPSMKAAAH